MPKTINLRGARVNNLKQVDLDIPHGQLLAICGVSGSGKTSLALDTLYAEGQRRYVESFSPYTRQFLEQLDKPDVDSLEGIPPAIAIRSVRRTTNRRTTVGSATEINDHLRLLYSKIGVPNCVGCDRTIETNDAESVAAKLAGLPEKARFQIAFEIAALDDDEDTGNRLDFYARHGFARAVLGDATVELTSSSDANGHAKPGQADLIVVDRLTSTSPPNRVRDSLETAFEFGRGVCLILSAEPVESQGQSPTREIDERTWHVTTFAKKLYCSHCETELPMPEPSLFSFNSGLGACAQCEGFGSIHRLDMGKIVPDQNVTLRDGAIAPWTTPAYKHELDELIALAGDYDLPLDVPFSDLTDDHVRLIWNGVPEREFGGLDGFFAWLEKRKYKMHLRIFLNRWRAYETCPKCDGCRLNSHALAFRIGKHNIAELSSIPISETIEFLNEIRLEPWQATVTRQVLHQIQRRLGYLKQVGVEYLSLDRQMVTVSNGEAQRVTLTTSLGSTLVNMLYVLDEPTSGLHPDDVQKLISAIGELHQRNNTIVCVDHNAAVIESAERILEIGPMSGTAGGEIVFDGDSKQLLNDQREGSTGSYLAGNSGYELPEKRRQPGGQIALTGASGNNLKNVDVSFPLGCLCVVSGVSGSGKSSLVQRTLYPALQERLTGKRSDALPFEKLTGESNVDEVVLIDQSPIGRSPRSNAMTYVKAFDDIRKLFAEQMIAKTRNYTAGHFSFNVAKGRCESCEGGGHIEIDMQFLADVYIRCPDCQGTRFRREILDVKHRGKNIDEVLAMPVDEAFSFFRGQHKVQTKLKTLMDVGLGYLPLGQPANSLSTGEAQRLKLALYLNVKSAKRCLFLMDEPTSGLHMADIDKLLETFDALLAVGHSIVAVEHNLQLMEQADWIIDMGPAAANKGGTIVAEGTPEQLAAQPDSRTGFHLSQRQLC